MDFKKPSQVLNNPSRPSGTHFVSVRHADCLYCKTKTGFTHLPARGKTPPWRQKQSPVGGFQLFL